MNKPLVEAKIAIYYDWLNQWGGAEKVLLNILKIFPQAELFTLYHDPNKSRWLPKNIKIHTSFLQNLPKTNFLTPIYDIAAETLDFKDFDIVISTTSNVGHSLLTNPHSLFVCYYHNLNRHIYLNPSKILLPLLNIYKNIDKILAKRPDYSLCNSTTTQQRLSSKLNINSKIVNPGINTKYFVPTKNPTNDYFLIVGRLVPHKSVDYVIKTFLNLNQKLVVVGTGREQNKLKKLAKHANNIIFTGQVNNDKLLSLYQNCTALICPQFEDFGIVSLESQGCGRPIIYFNKGGIPETNIENKTGISFNHQSQQSLRKAINKFTKTKFDNKFISLHAKQYDESVFMLKFKKEIDKLWHNKYL